MPLFDYFCEKCQTLEERMVKNADEIQHCAVCEQELAKRPSAPAFVLKGGGFHSTGTFPRSKEGPNLAMREELKRLPDDELNYEVGLGRDWED